MDCSVLSHYKQINRLSLSLPVFHFGPCAWGFAPLLGPRLRTAQEQLVTVKSQGWLSAQRADGFAGQTMQFWGRGSRAEKHNWVLFLNPEGSQQWARFVQGSPWPALGLELGPGPGGGEGVVGGGAVLV